MVIMQDALPGLKRFLKPVGLNERMLGLVIRCIVNCCGACRQLRCCVGNCC